MVWNEEAKIASSPELDGHAVTGLAISPDQQQLAASDGSGHVHLLKWPSLESIGKMKVVIQRRGVCFSQSGDQIFVDADNHLYQIASQADSEPQVLMSGKDWITKLAVSSSERLLMCASGGIHIIDFQSPATTKSFRGERDLVPLERAKSWSARENTVLRGSEGHGIGSPRKRPSKSHRRVKASQAKQNPSLRKRLKQIRSLRIEPETEAK